MRTYKIIGIIALAYIAFMTLVCFYQAVSCLMFKEFPFAIIYFFLCITNTVCFIGVFVHLLDVTDEKITVWFPLRSSKGYEPIPYDLIGTLRYGTPRGKIHFLSNCFFSEERCRKYCDKLNQEAYEQTKK